MKERVSYQPQEDAEAPPPAYEEIDRVRTPDSTLSPSQLSLRSNSTLSHHSNTEQHYPAQPPPGVSTTLTPLSSPYQPPVQPAHPSQSSGHGIAIPYRTLSQQSPHAEAPTGPLSAPYQPSSQPYYGGQSQGSNNAPQYQPASQHSPHELEVIHPESANLTAANLAAASSYQPDAQHGGSIPKPSPASPVSAPLAPTPSAPFNFPSASKTPFSPPAPTTGRPLIWALPQTLLSSTAPFLPAYAPSLIAYGIPEATWTSFVTTISAFLTAQVSQRALHHAGDIAVQVGKKHQELGKRLASNAAAKIQKASQDARRGNLVGVLGGTVSLAFGSATRIVGHVLELPLLTALTSEPKTPRQRAEAYLTTANESWLNGRHLEAVLVDSRALAKIAGVGGTPFVKDAMAAEQQGLEGQLAALGRHFEWLVVPESVGQGRVREDGTVERPAVERPGRIFLGDETLWLVVLRVGEGMGGQ